MKKVLILAGVLALFAILTAILLSPSEPGASEAILERKLNPDSSISPVPAAASLAEEVLPESRLMAVPETSALAEVASVFDRNAVYGIVSDVSGKPISGAKVSLFESEWAEPGAPAPKPLRDTATGSDGRFKISEMKPCRHFRLLAEAQGFAPGVLQQALSGKDAKILLQPEAFLTGKVLDVQSKLPLPGAKLSYLFAGLREAEIVSDAEGKFRLPMPAREQLPLSVSAEGYARQQISISVSAGETKERDFGLRKEGEIVGEVYDAETNQPIAGAEIVRGISTFARSEADGRFRLQSIETANGYLSAHASGYCSMRYELKFAIEGGMRLGLSRGVAIEGMVRDRQGKPILGASIQVELRENEEDALAGIPVPAASGRSGVHTISGGNLKFGTFGRQKPSRNGWAENSKSSRKQVTDREGRFRLEGIVPSAQEYYVTASHPDFCDGGKGVLRLVESGQKGFVDIELARGGIVEGLVSMEDKPASAVVWLRSETTSLEGNTNDGGEFFFEHVPEGVYKVSANPEGTEDWGEEQDGLNLIVAEGGKHRLELTIESGPIKPISGRVLSSEGKPVPFARLNAWANTNEGRFLNRQGKTAADGSFRLEVPDSGSALFQISAWDGTNGASVAKIAPGAEGVELRFPQQGKLRLRVTDARTGEPVTSFQIFLRDVAGKRNQSLSLTADANGVAETSFALGIFDLTVSAGQAGFRNMQISSIEISQQPSDPIRVEMLPGVKVNVRVVSADGASLPEAEDYWIQLLPATSAKPRFQFGNQGATLDASGRCAISGITPGKFRVNINPPNILLEPTEITVEDRDSVDIELKWKPKD